MEFQAYGVALIPLIIGLVEVAKQVGLPSKLAPALAVLLGLGVGFVMQTSGPAESSLKGLMIGLSASGLYSAGKTMLGK
jgi:hypothetical protein